MERLQGKKCPFYKEDCLLEKCALYDHRLDNCAYHLITYNLYKLDRTIASIPKGDDPNPPGRFPFPSRA